MNDENGKKIPTDRIMNLICQSIEECRVDFLNDMGGAVVSVDRYMAVYDEISMPITSRFDGCDNFYLVRVEEYEPEAHSSNVSAREDKI